MMKSDTLIIVSEDNHGDICWATSWDNALEWLLDNEDGCSWLDEGVEIYADDDSWQTVGEAFGDNWADEVRSMTMERFNEVFDGAFYAREERLV